MTFNTSINGLNNYTTQIEVLSHNIANTNTSGFKQSRVHTNNSTTPDVSTQFTQGTLNRTDSNLDLAISGGGFLSLSTKFGDQTFSRAGNFHVAIDGAIVNSLNQRLQGFNADDQGNITGDLRNLIIPSQQLQPRATENINIQVNLDPQISVPSEGFPVGFSAGNLPSSNSYNFSSGGVFNDSLGNQHTITAFFVKASTPNTFAVHLGIDGQDVSPSDSPTLAFTEYGKLAGNTNIVIENFNPGNGAASLSLNIDFADSTQYSEPFSIKNYIHDGFATGNLNTLGIDATGIVSANFSNGHSQTVGQVALANFNNPQALHNSGNTNFLETFSSGTPLFGLPGTNALGLINSGFLEGANTNLAVDMVSLIKAQRNFQANVQVIKTFDAISKTLL